MDVAVGKVFQAAVVEAKTQAAAQKADRVLAPVVVRVKEQAARGRQYCFGGKL